MGRLLLVPRGARMGRMHAPAQIHAIVDERETTEQQLSAVYSRWIDQVWIQHRILEHLIGGEWDGCAGSVCDAGGGAV